MCDSYKLWSHPPLGRGGCQRTIWSMSILLIGYHSGEKDAERYRAMGLYSHGEASDAMAHAETRPRRCPTWPDPFTAVVNVMSFP
jgi:hypothetical protein